MGGGGPSGWIGTQKASGVIQLNVIASGPPLPQNFGLYHGSKVSGTVFADTGVGGGSANDGAQDGTEAGIAAVSVQATGAATAAALTGGGGLYTLWVPAGAAGTLTVTPAAPARYLPPRRRARAPGGGDFRP